MSDDPLVFDDFDDFMRWQAAAEEAANARVMDWQRRIKPGDKVFRIYPMGREQLMILGQTIDPDQHFADMAPVYGIEEAASERDQMKARFERGYVYGHWYSLINKEGELGDAHISTLGPVTPDRLWNVWLDMIQAGKDPLREDPED
jgi:hypothetical protein